MLHHPVSVWLLRLCFNKEVLYALLIFYLVTVILFLYLQEIAMKERNQLPMFTMPTYVNASKHVDRISQEYLQKFGVNNFGDPYKVSADGSCLFNAVSVFLCGTEQLSTELRVRTCIEMVSRKDVYTS